MRSDTSTNVQGAEIFSLLAMAFLLLITAVSEKKGHEGMENDKNVSTAPEPAVNITEPQGSIGRDVPDTSIPLKPGRAESRQPIANSQSIPDSGTVAKEPEGDRGLPLIRAVPIEETDGNFGIPSRTPAEAPPMIKISEEQFGVNGFFAPLSAQPGEEFLNLLKDKIAREVEVLAKQSGCNALMIFGHTDEVFIKDNATENDRARRQEKKRLRREVAEPRVGFDDEMFVAAYAGNNVTSLRPGTNIELGMLRALCIVEIFTEMKKRDPTRFTDIQYFLPYSAGQLTRTDNTLISGRGDQREDKSRRRIEMILIRIN